MKNKLLIALLAITFVFCSAFAFTACDEDNGNDSTNSGNNQSPEQGGDTEKEPEKIYGSEGLEYNLSDDGNYYYFSGLGTCTETEIVIGNYYNDKPVKQIGKYAPVTDEELEEFEELIIELNGDIEAWCLFKYSNVTSVTISEGIEAIGAFSFAGYNGSNIKNVIIPDSVTALCYAAFSGCSVLENITLPDSVISIGTAAFGGCGSLASITFNGTKEQWDAIKKDDQWDNFAGDYAVHCTDGDIEKDD